jgi:hypothetical protein
MTTYVVPSTSREVVHSALSAAGRWGGSDWIVPANVDLNASNQGLSGAPLNAAAITTSGLDVEIDTVEAFIGGAWVGSDDAAAGEHTHTLPGNSTTTTLYLGVDHSATDTIIFGPSGDFASADPKLPIADVVDDGGVVTAVRDRRPVGYTDQAGTLLAATYDADSTSPLTLDTGTLAETYPVYDVVIYREMQFSGEGYQSLQLNGISTSNYHADYYDGKDNDHSSVDDQSAWGKLAGCIDTFNDWAGFALQTVRVACPPEIVSNGKHWPILEMTDRGVGKDADYLVAGSLSVDTAAVERLNLFGGGDATGFVEVYGCGLSYGGEAA